MRYSLFILFIIGLAVTCVTGCERPMTQSMMDAATGDTADTAMMDDPAAFAIAFVQEAVDLYKAEGAEAAIAHYNTPASIVGQWYTFITDEADMIVAHAPRPDLVGTDIKDAKGPAGDYPLAQIIHATEAGIWVPYLWNNPESGNNERKWTWAIKYENYIFSAGYYEPVDDATTMDDPAAFAIAFVQEAVDLYKAKGSHAAIAYYNNPISIIGQWYTFITDESDMIVAHAPRPDLVGTDIKDAKGPAGDYPLAQIIHATETGIWVPYLWNNPETGNNERKWTWAIKYENYIFSAGYYEPVTDDITMMDDPEAVTLAFVQGAIDLYEAKGIQAAIAYYNNPMSVMGQWYVFIVDEADITVAHAPSPDLVGTDLKASVGSDGFPIGEEIAKATEAGIWVEYLWDNPETGQEALKRTWAIRHDGYIFGSGHYEPAAE